MLGKFNTLAIVAMDAAGATDSGGEEALGPGGHFYFIQPRFLPRQGCW
jgi:hypothetical protein